MHLPILLGAIAPLCATPSPAIPPTQEVRAVQSQQPAQTDVQLLRDGVLWLTRHHAPGDAEAISAVRCALRWLLDHGEPGSRLATANAPAIRAAVTWLAGVEPGEAADAIEFDREAFANVLSVGLGGGGAGGAFGAKLRPLQPVETRRAVDSSLRWLLRHQSEQGNWDVDEFMRANQVGPSLADGPGSHPQDVGVSALATLALMSDGNLPGTGPGGGGVERALAWLRSMQDPETGFVGEMIGHTFAYDHAIASLTLCKALALTEDEALREPAQRALNWILRARNPYGAWRYDMPPVGDNDTSVSTWMLMALRAGKDAGLEIDEQALTGMRNWLDEASDPATGRCGYDSMGSVSSRIMGVNDHFPPEAGEAMTAAALLGRHLLGEEPGEMPIMDKHAALLHSKLPAWQPEQGSCDFYYWFFGTLALARHGGEHWQAWQNALPAAVLDSQRRDGDFNGSWDAVGPWSPIGGRVYSTALMSLSLQAAHGAQLLNR